MDLTIAGVADIVPGTVHKPLPDSPFFEYTRSADISVGNLEVPLTGRLHALHEGIVLHAPPSFAVEMPRSGIGVASIANNHIGGHGQDGIDDTLAACAAAGVITMGFGVNREAASAPIYVDVKGTKVALVCATSVGPVDTFATDGPGVSAIRVVTTSEYDPRAAANPGVIGKVITVPDEADLSLLESQVRAAKLETPIVVAVLHWGLGELVLDYMRIVARRLIDAGASMVFGHHSHRLAAVDWYEGAPIFYGLGSFLFQYDGDAPVHIPRDAAAALVKIDSETGAVSEARLVVGRLDADGVPWPTTPERVERVVEDVMRLSAMYDVAFSPLPDGCLISGRD